MRQDVRRRDVVFRPGDPAYDLIVIETGWIEIVSPATGEEPEAVVARYGPGGFLGELNLLTGQTAYLTARVVEAGRIHRISRERFRELMADDPEVSDVLLRTFLARRDQLRDSPAARGIEIVGSGISADTLALRTYAARQRLPHLWLDADSLAGRALIRLAPLDAADLPAVITPTQVLRRATPGQLADALALSYRPTTGRPHDLTIIGSGPAGLAAAVASSSEGLTTLLLDAVGVGGQAAASSRIENHLGFPSGISGFDLTQRAALQAMKFGTQLASPCPVTALDTDGEYLRVVLADDTSIDTRAVLIATGARYRALPLARWAEFEDAGIYYAATELEARACQSEPVTVIGGANSAGQAALYLASRGSLVILAVHGPEIRAEMSAYLVDRLYAPPPGHRPDLDRSHRARRRSRPRVGHPHRRHLRRRPPAGVPGAVLLHWRRRRDGLAPRRGPGRRRLHPHRHRPGPGLPRSHLDHTRPSTPAVRNKRPRRLRRRRRPSRLGQACRLRGRRRCQRRPLDPHRHRRAPLTPPTPTNHPAKHRPRKRPTGLLRARKQATLLGVHGYLPPVQDIAR